MPSKALVVADSHGLLKHMMYSYYLPDKDDVVALIFLGDHSRQDVLDLCDMYPNTTKLGVPGNHDDKSLYDGTPVININGQAVKLDSGLTIGGIGGSLRYSDDPYKAMYTQNEYMRMVNNLPDCDLLITHAAPESKHTRKQSNIIKRLFNIVDFEAHDGVKALTKWCINKENYPGHKYMIHGHLHESLDYRVGGCAVLGVYGFVTIDLSKLI